MFSLSLGKHEISLIPYHTPSRHSLSINWALPRRPPPVTSVFKTSSLFHFSHACLSFFQCSIHYLFPSFSQCSQGSLSSRQSLQISTLVVSRRPFSSRTQTILIFLFRCHLEAVELPYRSSDVNISKTISLHYFSYQLQHSHPSGLGCRFRLSSKSPRFIAIHNNGLQYTLVYFCFAFLQHKFIPQNWVQHVYIIIIFCEVYIFFSLRHFTCLYLLTGMYIRPLN